MSRYAFRRNTKVVIAPAVPIILSPTVAQLNAGSNITCELVGDAGLAITPDTKTITEVPWYGDLEYERVTRYSVSALLTAYRQTVDATELLWNLAILRNRGYLVVRYGKPHDVAWAAGDKVEVYDFRYGKRANRQPSLNEPAGFTVPLFVTDATDVGVVVA